MDFASADEDGDDYMLMIMKMMMTIMTMMMVVTVVLTSEKRVYQVSRTLTHNLNCIAT